MMVTELKPYPEYKDSGVPWLGPVPEHWETRRLKSLLGAPITDGPHVTPTFVSDGMPFLSVDGIQNGNLVFEKCRYVSPEDHVEFRKKTAPRRDDILLVKAASTGKIARVQVDFEFSIWSPLALIRPDHFQVLSPFLEYALKDFSSQAQIETLCTLNTQKNISMDDIPKVLLPLPPIAEQEAIVRYLDHADRKVRHAIRARQQLIKLLTEQKQSIIQRAVTRGLDPSVRLKPSGVPWLSDVPEHWGVDKIKHLARPGYKTFVDGDWIESPYITSDGIRLIQTGNISIGTYREQGFRYVNGETFDSLSCTEVMPGDVLICRLGDPVGRACLAPRLGVRMITSVDVCILKPRADINPVFLVNVMTSRQYLSWVGSLVRGSTRDRVSRSMLGGFTLPMPPLLEQDAIVRFLNNATASLDKAIDAARREINLLREYRTRLIADVVTGKLDVRDVPVPDDETDVLPEELENIDDVEAIDATDDAAETDSSSEERA